MKLIKLFCCLTVMTITGCTTLERSNLQLQDNSTARIITILNKTISVSVIPELGGKISCLKRINGDNILSRSNRKYVKREYGMKYGDTEFDGIDEIFPSLEECKYPVGQWQGVEIPDHGELFSQAWKHIKGPGITLEVSGKKLPYTFRRQIMLKKNQVILKYKVTNNSPYDLHYFYMLHPLLKGENNTKMFINNEQRTIISHNYKAFLGPLETETTWGDLASKDGKKHKDNLFTINSGRYWKLFFPDVDLGYARVLYNDNEDISFSWNTNQLPCYAIWCSEGILNGLNHIAPEPATSIIESLEKGYKKGKTKIIKGGQSVNWEITITL